MQNRVAVSLTGGLGNQLFQLAVALFVSKNEDVVLRQEFGAPRVSLNGQPQIFELLQRSDVVLGKKKSTHVLFRKIIGFLLRKGISQYATQKYFQSKRIFIFLGTWMISLSNYEYRRLYIGDGVGFFDLPGKLLNSKKKMILVGYFQSYYWASDAWVYSKLMELDLVNTRNEYEILKLEALESHPIIVHVRLGDYKNEKSFGLLDAKYYSDSMDLVCEASNSTPVWLFSDEPQDAMTLIPEKFKSNLRLISENSLTPQESFQIMRMGSAYVIANSSYSWWAAFLRYDTNAKVIAPATWFREIESPEKLLPPDWVQIKSTWRG
jgi:hypothetical protein